MAYTIYDTDGVVIDSWPYKESSRRLLVYTRDIGRILVQAQSVRSVDSKLQSAAQRFAESNIELVFGAAGWRLVGAHPHRNFYFTAQEGRPAIRRTAGLITRLVPDQRPDKTLYQSITAGLQALAAAGSEVGVIEKLFVFRLMAQLGYAPDPSAQRLNTFLQAPIYDQQTVAAFAEHKQTAVTQINQGLQNTQL